MTQSFGRTDTEATQDNLIAGQMPRIEYGITLVSGENLSRGAVLGRITTSGKYQEWDPNAGTGIENPRCILAEDCDASSGDEKTVAFFTGQFYYDGIQWVAAKHQDDDRLDAILALHDRSIYITKAGEDLLEATHTSTTTTTSTSTTTTTTAP